MAYAGRIDAARQLKLYSGDTAILSGNTYIIGGFTGGTDSQFFGTVKGYDAVLPNEFITLGQFTGGTTFSGFTNQFIQNQDVSGQTASFEITGTGVIGSALTINSGFLGYQTVITSKHDNSDTFEVQQNNSTVFKYFNPNFSGIGEFETLQLGNIVTKNNNLYGSIILSGTTGAVTGIGRGVYLNDIIYAGNNGDTLIGLDIETIFGSSTPITALDNSSLVNGSGYTTGTYFINFSNNNNHFGATGNIMVSGGIVTGVTLVYGGYNYQVGDVLTGTFGNGTGFSINVLTVGSYSGLTNIGLKVNGNALFNGGIQATGLTTGTTLNYIGLDSGNNFVLGPGGSGSSYNFNDGLILTGGTTVQLGGPLTQNTIIPLSGYSLSLGSYYNNNYIVIEDSGGINIRAGGASQYGIMGVSTSALQLQSVNTFGQQQIGMASTSGASILVTETIGNIGFEYAADYSTNGSLSSLWIPSWGFVQSATTIVYTSIFSGSGTTGSPLGLNIDNNPTSGSFNLVYSGGVYNALLADRNAANFGQTASLAVVAQYTDPGFGDNTYRVGCWLNILSVSGGDSVTIQVTYEDEASVSRTKTFYVQGSTTASLSSLDDYCFPTMDFRAKSGSVITVSTTVTGSGSILYDCGGTIQTLIGH